MRKQEQGGEWVQKKNISETKEKQKNQVTFCVQTSVNGLQKGDSGQKDHQRLGEVEEGE